MRFLEGMPPGSGPAMVALSRDDLAGLAGTARETVNRTLVIINRTGHHKPDGT